MMLIDVWGGENSMEHVARMMRPEFDAMTVAEVANDLKGGYLVNVRRCDLDAIPFGPECEFDDRASPEMSS